MAWWQIVLALVFGVPTAIGLAVFVCVLSALAAMKLGDRWWSS